MTYLTYIASKILTHDKEKLIKDAIVEIGTTDNFKEAGYILEDGTMLDFSGGKSGKQTIDHGAVGELDQMRKNGSRASAEFMLKTGAITCHDAATFAVAKAPTEKQLDIMLENYNKKYGANSEMDIYISALDKDDPYGKDGDELSFSDPTTESITAGLEKHFNKEIEPKGYSR